MHELIARDPRNAERIFPYIGGEELNDDPEQKPRRWVIIFDERTEAEARGFPDLFAIIETRVKPDRQKTKIRNIRACIMNIGNISTTESSSKTPSATSRGCWRTHR
jgi:hypothetical protein